MTLLNRYLVKETIKYFSLVFALVIGLFVAVDYLGTMDEFLQADISLFRAFFFVLLKVPFVAVQLIPVALLLAVLVVFGLMSKHNEIVIVKSSGISVYSLLKPMVVLGAISSMLLVLFSEILVPATMAKANAIKFREIRKEEGAIFKEHDIWHKGNRTITHIQYYNTSEKTMHGFTRFFFDDRFQLIRRMDAEKGVFTDRQWVLENVMVLSSEGNDGEYRSTAHETRISGLGFEPQDLKAVMKRSEEMNFLELLTFIEKVEQDGYDATQYKVDLYGKTAFPFVCIIMSLIGVSLTARGKLTKGLPAAISYGISIAFLYWVFYSFCLSLGYGELLPPIVAAWVANLIFLIVGIIALINAE